MVRTRYLIRSAKWTVDSDEGFNIYSTYDLSIEVIIYLSLGMDILETPQFTESI